MKKYNAIELLRLYFLVLIISGHTVMAGAVRDMLGTEMLFNTMGSRVNIFMLICGFFLYRSMAAHPDQTFWTRFRHRCARILPALVLYKVLCTAVFGMAAGGSLQNLLSNLFMLNLNIGIDVPTITHVIWYVDVMFWVYLFYLALFELLPRGRAFLTTGVLMILSLTVLFSNPGVNLHFQMAAPYLDGGILRGIAFIGMGILLAAIPNARLSPAQAKKWRVPATVAEAVSVVAVVGFPFLFAAPDKTLALNHTLWAAVFVFLMSREYGALSRWLNGRGGVGRLSRYSYEVYVFQFFAITLGEKYLAPRTFPLLSLFCVVVCAFFIGIAVKELFDNRLVKKYLGLK